MVIARGTSKDGKGTLLILGLSAENLRRLQNNEPIVKDLSLYGVPNLEICITFGKTEQDIYESLKPSIAPDTKIEKDPRL